MRTIITVSRRGAGYVANVTGKFGGGHSGVRIGLTHDEAAVGAVNLMMRYAFHNPEGWDLIAPEAVQNLVPEHLRSGVPTAEGVG